MIIGKEINIAINNVFSYLDTLDLTPYIKQFKDEEVSDLMNKL